MLFFFFYYFSSSFPKGHEYPCAVVDELCPWLCTVELKCALKGKINTFPNPRLCGIKVDILIFVHVPGVPSYLICWRS